MSVGYRPVRRLSDNRQPAHCGDGADRPHPFDHSVGCALRTLAVTGSARPRDFYGDRPVPSAAIGCASRRGAATAGPTAAPAHPIPRTAGSAFASQRTGAAAPGGTRSDSGAARGSGFAGRWRSVRSDGARAGSIAPRSGRSAFATVDPAFAPLGRDGDCAVESRMGGTRCRTGYGCAGRHPIEGGYHYRCCIGCVSRASSGRASSRLSPGRNRHRPGPGIGRMDLAGCGGHRTVACAGGGRSCRKAFEREPVSPFDPSMRLFSQFGTNFAVLPSKSIGESHVTHQ